MTNKNILVSGYSSFLCRNLKNSCNHIFYDYKNLKTIKEHKFHFFIHFAVINKISPSKNDYITEMKLLNRLLNISKKYQINKFILMSTFQPKGNLNQYQLMKSQLEKKVLNSNINFLILRPTKIINNLELLVLKVLVSTKFNKLLKYKPNRPILLKDFICVFKRLITTKRNNNSIYEIFSNFHYPLKQVNSISSINKLFRIKLIKKKSKI